MPGVLVLFVLVVLAPVEAGQPRAFRAEAYDEAVEAYAGGRELTATLAALQPWTRKDFEAAVERLVLARNVRQLEAAAVFELEIGIGAMSASPAGAEIHFNLGEKMLRALSPTREELRLNPARAEEVHRLWSTWFGVAGSGFLWITDTRRALPWILKGLAVTPRSAALKVLEGSAHEIDAGHFDTVVPRPGPGRSGAYFDHFRRLDLAYAAFRAASVADPHNAYARIRLGRLLFRLDRAGEAREAIARALAVAGRPDDVYLGSLFLGAIEERQRNFAAAREAYTRALTVAPRGQTVIIALSHLELISGRPDQAQSLAKAFAASPVDDHAWWAYKNGGLDLDGLAALRARVRQ
jgi:tetratricopeptide (TPR) repeat protein